jgi:RNA recognition motif-containing protein
LATKLFVGNLPYDTDATELLGWFERNGFPAEDVCLSVDRLSGHPRGFGSVQIGDEVAMQCVRACNGRDSLGRTLIINIAQPLRRPYRTARARSFTAT